MYINDEIFILVAIVKKTNKFGHKPRTEGLTQANLDKRYSLLNNHTLKAAIKKLRNSIQLSYRFTDLKGKMKKKIILQGLYKSLRSVDMGPYFN